MSVARAMRRRAAKDAAKHAKPTTEPTEPTIQLANPMTEHFCSFIIGNALAWEVEAHNALIRTNPEAAESLEPYWGLTAMIQSGFQDGPAFDAWERFRRYVDA